MTIKLNLGCGNKIYPRSEGWVNVDIVIPPVLLSANKDQDNEYIFASEEFCFKQADLKTLDTLEDNYADEAHSYHVVEHFYPSDLVLALTEWLRVLKPGGILVTEAPDVKKCAINFLFGLEHRDEVMASRMGLLGIFGEPDPEAPFMAHHWGWYPESFTQLLLNVGFTDIKEEPAKTHMGPIRDFRIVARKPLSTDV